MDIINLVIEENKISYDLCWNYPKSFGNKLFSYKTIVIEKFSTNVYREVFYKQISSYPISKRGG